MRTPDTCRPGREPGHSSSRSRREGAEAAGRCLRVLLLEDYRPLCAELRQHLEEATMHVEVARATAEGDQKARSGGHDLLVLDLTLRGSECLALLRGWRRAGVSAHVLALVPAQATRDMVASLDAGADDCLETPFDFAELLARLRALTRRRTYAQEPVVRIGELEIDTRTRSVSRGGVPIPLTPLEYTLLDFLARHRGRVVSRSLIRRHLYDDGSGRLSNVVDVYVGYLRGKIDKGFSPPLLVTRRGEGYMLRDPNAGESKAG